MNDIAKQKLINKLLGTPAYFNMGLIEQGKELEEKEAAEDKTTIEKIIEGAAENSIINVVPNDAKNENLVSAMVSNEIIHTNSFNLPEILNHGDGAVDLTYLNSFGALHLNHDPNIVVGAITNAVHNPSDKTFSINGVFDNDPFSQQIKNKVLVTKSIKGVSGKLQRVEVNLLQEGEKVKGVPDTPRPLVHTVRWRPEEVSFTSQPRLSSARVMNAKIKDDEYDDDIDDDEENINTEKTKKENKNMADITMSQEDFDKKIEAAYQKGLADGEKGTAEGKPDKKAENSNAITAESCLKIKSQCMGSKDLECEAFNMLAEDKPFEVIVALIEERAKNAFGKNDPPTRDDMKTPDPVEWTDAKIAAAFKQE